MGDPENMKDYARSFYKSEKWILCSRGYMSSKNYICERCGAPAKICHHKKHLTPDNINDPLVSLNWDNLECLCQECHNIEHMQKKTKVYFDDSGQVVIVTESAQIREYQADMKQIDDVIDRAVERVLKSRFPELEISDEKQKKV